LHSETGEVVGVDPERPIPIFFVNSKVDAFAVSFRLLDDHFSGRCVSKDLGGGLRSVDGNGFAKSDWLDLVDYVTSA
jgi:hypothetical protein